MAKLNAIRTKEPGQQMDYWHLLKAAVHPDEAKNWNMFYFRERNEEGQYMLVQDHGAKLPVKFTDLVIYETVDDYLNTLQKKEYFKAVTGFSPPPLLTSARLFTESETDERKKTLLLTLKRYKTALLNPDTPRRSGHALEALNVVFTELENIIEDISKY